MKITLTKDLKIKLLDALQKGILNTNDIPELTNEQPLFPDPNFLTKSQIENLSRDEVRLLLKLAEKFDGVFSIKYTDLIQ